MTHPSRLAAVALLASVAVVWAALPPAGQAGHRCKLAGARTIAESSEGRLLSRGRPFERRYYGCLFRQNRVRLLARVDTGNGQEASLPRVAGRFAALAISTPAGEEEVGAEVRVWDLRRGRLRTACAAVADPRGEELFVYGVRSLALHRSGAVAWLSLDYDPAPHLYEVHKRDSTGHYLLDSGTEIQPRSLRLRRARVSWINAGAERSADLGAPPPEGAEPLGDSCDP